MKVIIELEIEGKKSDMDEIFDVVDDLLDAGSIQDLINEGASDRGLELRVAQAKSSMR